MHRVPIALMALAVMSCSNDHDTAALDANANDVHAGDDAGRAELDANIVPSMDATIETRRDDAAADAETAIVDAPTTDAGLNADNACDAGIACDGACIDVQSNVQHCGACNVVCPEGFGCHQAHCQAEVGCSDGSREAFASTARYPTIAGCAATWPLSSLRAASTGVACGDTLKQCKVPADACAKGWHVCGGNAKGPDDLTDRISHDECYAEAGRWAIALGDQSCTDCSDDSSGAACCGDGCLQQMGICIWPDATGWWGVVDDVMNSCNAIENTYASVQAGVLCCRS